MHDLPGAWRRTALGAGLIAPDGTSVPTIFAEMTALAASTGALNLGQGFPDEDGPEVVLEAARRAIADGVNQYAPGRGFPDLLTAIAEHQQRFYGIELDPSRQVLVTVERPRPSPPPFSRSSTARTTRSSSSSPTTTPTPPVWPWRARGSSPCPCAGRTSNPTSRYWHPPSRTGRA